MKRKFGCVKATSRTGSGRSVMEEGKRTKRKRKKPRAQFCNGGEKAIGKQSREEAKEKKRKKRGGKREGWCKARCRKGGKGGARRARGVAPAYFVRSFAYLVRIFRRAFSAFGIASCLSRLRNAVANGGRGGLRPCGSGAGLSSRRLPEFAGTGGFGGGLRLSLRRARGGARV